MTDEDLVAAIRARKQMTAIAKAAFESKDPRLMVALRQAVRAAAEALNRVRSGASDTPSGDRPG